MEDLQEVLVQMKAKEASEPVMKTKVEEVQKKVETMDAAQDGIRPILLTFLVEKDAYLVSVAGKSTKKVVFFIYIQDISKNL